MGKVQLKWVEERIFVGTDSNGHSTVIGKDHNSDHPWEGMKPSDLLLLAVASCSAFDVVEILKKQREPVINFKVECTGEQQHDPPWTFTTISMVYKFWGDINPSKAEKAIRISEEKYCCVINSLRPTVQFTSTYEIIK